MTTKKIITVLDTSFGDVGEDQVADFDMLIKDKPVRFSASISYGDIVVIKGKAEASDEYQVIYTFMNDTPADVYLSTLWTVERITDGGAEPKVYSPPKLIAPETDIFVQVNNVSASDLRISSSFNIILYDI